MSSSPPAVPVPARRRKAARLTPTRVAPDPGTTVAGQRRTASGEPFKGRGVCCVLNNPGATAAGGAAAQLAALEGLCLTGAILYMIVAYEHQHPQPTAEGGTPHFQVGSPPPPPFCFRHP